MTEIKTEVAERGGRFFAYGIVVMSIFAIAKAVGFFPFSWWWVFGPVLGTWAALFVVGTLILGTTRRVKEIVEKEAEKTRNLMVIDFTTILQAEIEAARLNMLQDIEAAFDRVEEAEEEKQP
ncbi:hypothetical protein [Microcystis phage Mwe-JY26]